MKINNPVHCQSLFQRELEAGARGLWCVSLRLNGQILALCELKTEECQFSKESLARLSQLWTQSQAKVALLLEFNPKNSNIEERDFIWVEAFSTFASQHQLLFADFIKMSQTGFNSLYDFGKTVKGFHRRDD